MRYGYLLLGLAIGAGYALYRSGMTPETTRTYTPTKAPKQRLQGEQESSQVEGLVDEVVHRRDIPETPVKQAFEAALGEHPHTAT